MVVSHSRTRALYVCPPALHRGSFVRHASLHRPADNAPIVRWLIPSWRCCSSQEPEKSPRPPTRLSRDLFAAGCIGTGAVFLGNWLNVDPYGNIHFDMEDVLIGVLAGLPVAVMHLTLFYFRFYSESDDPSSEAAPGAIRSAPRTKQALFDNALLIYTAQRQGEYVSSGESFPIMLLRWLVLLIPDTMLWTCVGLTVTGNWFRDRLIEANVQDVFQLSSGGVDQIGKCCALLCLVAPFVAVTMRKASVPEFKMSIKVVDLGRQEMRNVDSEERKEIPKSLVQSASAHIRLAKILNSVIKLSSMIGTAMAFIVSGNLLGSLSTGATTFVSRTLFAQRSLAEMDVDVREAVETGSKTPHDSLLSTIQGKPYLRLKSAFREKITEAEARQAVAEAPQQSEHERSASESDAGCASPGSTEGSEAEEGTSKTTELPMALDLSSLSFVFQITLRDLDMSLSSEGVEQTTRQILTEEKDEVANLLTRARELLYKEGEKEKTTTLNFYRDVKDRYKGGEK